jgi:hypothetical protein
MAVEEIILAPESFRTIYLRKEDRVILRTENGRKIIVKRIIPDEWQAYRIYDYEKTINENKKEILLFDNRYLSQLTRDFVNTIRTDQ